MDTPIADFVKKYCDDGTVRFHMPGHKGHGVLGTEQLDITEVKGADALYEASGIIEKSESNATALFGTQKTLYSTEGSSQCIRAMLYLAVLTGKGNSQPVILAARNVHKAFLYAGALLDIQVEWLYGSGSSSICSCIVSPKELEDRLSHMEHAPAAVYITSPDYLGGMSDVKSLSAVCHRYGTYLLVDNAHGAYTHFLEKSMHPMDLGADMCCDSAHKTLPVLTGGAYLHIGKCAPRTFAENAMQAMALFGSTSPSYLILQSLDLCNAYLAGDYRTKLMDFVSLVDDTKKRIQGAGYNVVQSDPLKIVLYGDGRRTAEKLRASNIECEYSDCDYLVLMVTPENTAEELEALIDALGKNEAVIEPDTGKNSSFGTETGCIPELKDCRRELSLRRAFFSKHRTVPVSKAEGMICAAPLVSCPPAIPIVISGERITEEAVYLFEKYGITQVDVVDNF